MAVIVLTRTGAKKSGLRRGPLLGTIVGLALLTVAPSRGQAQSQNPTFAPPAPNATPAPFKPSTDDGTPDVWIFSGELSDSHETYSGTLVANKGEAQFELKLGGGATCDGDSLSGEVGLVRLNEITCSDKRTMRALFVPQNGRDLKVFGHVGDERFRADAHLLGTEPPPEAKQTAQPTVPALQGRPGALPQGPASPAPIPPKENGAASPR